MLCLVLFTIHPYSIGPYIPDTHPSTRPTRPNTTPTKSHPHTHPLQPSQKPLCTHASCGKCPLWESKSTEEEELRKVREAGLKANEVRTNFE